MYIFFRESVHVRQESEIGTLVSFCVISLMFRIKYINTSTKK